MPKVIKTPKPKQGFKIGIVKPDGSKFQREYRSMNKMKQFRRYYKEKGYNTRVIPI